MQSFMVSPYQLLGSCQECRILEDDHFCLAYTSKKRLFFFREVSWIHGPVLKSGDFSIEQTAEIMRKITLKLRKEKVDLIRNAIFPIHDLDRRDFWIKVYERAGFLKAGKWATYLLFLNDMEEIFKNLSSGLRKNVRRMERKGIWVKKVESKEEAFYQLKLLNESRKRSGAKLIDSKLWGKKEHWKLPNRAYFIAYLDDIPLATQGVFFSDTVAIEVAIGVSDYAIQNKIYAGDYLKWWIIKWCFEKGIKIYDLAGVSPEPKDKKEENIRKYKEKWGGVYIEYPLWNYILDPFKGRILWMGHMIREKWGSLG